MKKPRRPTAITMCSIREMMRGESCRKCRWCSRLMKASGGHGAEVQRRG